MRSATEAIKRLVDPENGRVYAEADFLQEVDALRQHAVAAGDQGEAKLCWIAETIAICQRSFVHSFELAKSGQFYEAWCEFERCEINLMSLARHHEVDAKDPHAIRYITGMVVQWQAVYPYKVFFSPEMLKRKVLCGICDAVVRPRASCGHRKHEIYDGKLCTHKVVDVQMLAISIVTNPVQKYSVAFSNIYGEDVIDGHDYSSVKYAADRVTSPWHGWSSFLAQRELQASDVAHIQATEPCPCYSEKAFGDCCHGKGTLLVPHRQYMFREPTPPGLPSLELVR
jgi:hypothetical protein